MTVTVTNLNRRTGRTYTVRYRVPDGWAAADYARHRVDWWGDDHCEVDA